MFNPLQYLAANGVAFVAGVAVTLAFKVYGNHMHAAGIKEGKARAQ